MPTTIDDFLAYMHNHFKSTAKIVRSDNGTEIVQHSCSKLFASKGLINQRSIPCIPQQNGRVERKHRHLLETARDIRFHANLPLKFWGDCLLAATLLINLMPSLVFHWKISYHFLMNKPPNLSFLRVIECLCFAAIKNSDKFASRVRRCVLLGYPYAQKEYKLFDLDTN